MSDLEQPRLTTFEFPGSIEDAWAIRRAVFIDEQGVTEREEVDDLDPECVHVLAELEGRSVGAARLRDDGHGTAKAERVAVLRDARGRGVGRALMRELERIARARGCRDVLLGAQVSAVPFYLALGYVIEGDEFLDARIPHRWMRHRLEANTE